MTKSPTIIPTGVIVFIISFFLLLTPVVTQANFLTTLKEGDVASDVRSLQQFLNSRGFTVAETGPGSAGQETNHFGAGTKSALIRFQETYRDDILTPAGLTQGTGYFGLSTIKKVNELRVSSSSNARQTTATAPSPESDSSPSTGTDRYLTQKDLDKLLELLYKNIGRTADRIEYSSPIKSLTGIDLKDSTITGTNATLDGLTVISDANISGNANTGSLRVSNSDGYVPLWKTSGTAFSLASSGNGCRPTLVDINSDSLLDLYCGGFGGNAQSIFAYQNTGTKNTPVWTRKSEWDIPSPTYGHHPKVEFGDLDGDGLIDAGYGNYYSDSAGYFRFYKNTGTKANPQWTYMPSWTPAGMDFKYPVPAMVDIDNDGLLDLFVIGGNPGARVYIYKNTGTKFSPAWSRLLDWETSFANTGIPGSSNKYPWFSDLDRDGDIDLIVGRVAFENTGTSEAFQYSRKSSWDGNSQCNYVPTYGDVDGDGDFDMFCGSWYSSPVVDSVLYHNVSSIGDALVNFSTSNKSAFLLNSLGDMWTNGSLRSEYAGIGPALSVKQSLASQNIISLSGASGEVFAVSNDGGMFASGGISVMSSVGIGTTSPSHKLTVVGDIFASGAIYASDLLDTAPDYVFEPGYLRLSLAETEAHTTEHQHLPWLTPRGTGAMSIGARVNEILEALENLFLHVFDLAVRVARLENRDAIVYETDDRLDEYGTEIETLKSQNATLLEKIETLEARLAEDPAPEEEPFTDPEEETVPTPEEDALDPDTDSEPDIYTDPVVTEDPEPEPLP